MSTHLPTLMVNVYYATVYRRQTSMVTEERLANAVRFTCHHVTAVTLHLARYSVTLCSVEMPKLIEREDSRVFSKRSHTPTQLNCITCLPVMASCQLFLLPT